MTSRLPSAFVVDAAKVTDYLLNLKHPRGGAKARFFISVDFHPDQPQRLGRSWLSHARDGFPSRSYACPYGYKIEIDRSRLTPDRRSPRLRTVWMMSQEGGEAQFITALG